AKMATALVTPRVEEAIKILLNDSTLTFTHTPHIQSQITVVEFKNPLIRSFILSSLGAALKSILGRFKQDFWLWNAEVDWTKQPAKLILQWSPLIPRPEPQRHGHGRGQVLAPRRPFLSRLRHSLGRLSRPI